ncbi:MAG: DNA-directed RNA polymerase subunit beta' [Rickettsiales bacterium]|jgi:DNA-directed RNA polymerase subunit beta'|nr:DNA-directed RNA polymerase subunit beta' [Rickettsiales bacterium]
MVLNNAYSHDFVSNSNQSVNLSDYDAIKISIASPEKIRSWSYGEVTQPETINYRTGKPEIDGLFCQKIFGPVKDYECACGKYKQIKYKGIVCEKCGTEVTSSKVRRERMGHIELMCPMAHIWFIPKIETLLECKQGKIKDVIYYEKYIIVDAKMTDLKEGQILSDFEYEDAIVKYGKDKFEVGIGATAIKEILSKMDLQREKKKIVQRLSDEKISKSEKIKVIKKLNLLNDFIESGNKPEWMILTALPVIPPDLRPIVQLDSGQWSSGDLNELYRRILNRNNRLKTLIQLESPDLIIKIAKKMLQQMVDALFDNEKLANPVKTMNKRQFKSLSDSLKGKTGRFRQNLLGKRVDYSGRSIIVVGSELKMHQCGLPKKMALELFKPFIYSKLEQYGLSTSIKQSKKLVEEEAVEIWDILEEIVKEHPVLLNRPPTLHRLSIQAFEPVLIEGNAIQLHPLVCSAFNADFDGDAMAVHVPLSIEAQTEARVLMMSTNNILHPKDGKPMITPSCDMMFGIYYITMDNEKISERPYIVSCFEELEQALFKKIITLHDTIVYKFKVLNEKEELVSKVEKTTAGRVKLFNTIPEKARTLEVFSLFNKVIAKKDIKELLDYVYRRTTQHDTCTFGDNIMELGFKESCKSGLSVGKDDMITPNNKEAQVEKTRKDINKIQQNYDNGLMTENERYNKIVTAWSTCSSDVAKELFDSIEKENNPLKANSLYLMMTSGSRGNKSQIQQASAMRGLMTDVSGGIIEVPVISSLKEGLNGYEYFISTNLARKGFASVALLTAKGGYFTRKLSGVAQDIVVTEDDCGSDDGILLEEKIDNKGRIINTLAERALGRTLSKDVLSEKGKILIKKNTIVDEQNVKILEENDIKKVEVRSALTCKCKDGICAKCYGRDLSIGNLVSIGEAVGVIAAQAIGEPGTQLTLNTKHNIGGNVSSIDFINVPYDGILNFVNYKDVIDRSGNSYVTSRNFKIEILSLSETKSFLTSFKVPYGAKIFVKDGEKIKKGTKIVEWDKFSIPLISTFKGKASFENLKVRKRLDENNNSVMFFIADNNPIIKIGDKPFELENGAFLNIKDGDDVEIGDVIAKISKGISGRSDITGGLAEVEHLFELTKKVFVEQKSNLSVICEVNGIVNIKKNNANGKKKILIISKENKETLAEYDCSFNKNLLVEEGDVVKNGDYLLDGYENPNDILRIFGISAFSKYMTENVQRIYEAQGIEISDKHIELILSKMIKNVEVIDAGDTEYNVGDSVEKKEFEINNERLSSEGLKPAVAKFVALGVTESSVKKSDSFIAAMSLQNTQEILVNSSIKGKVDNLKGLKENMILGRLIPAGTGLLVDRIKKNNE